MKPVQYALPDSGILDYTSPPFFDAAQSQHQYPSPEEDEDSHHGHNDTPHTYASDASLQKVSVFPKPPVWHPSDLEKAFKDIEAAASSTTYEYMPSLPADLKWQQPAHPSILATGSQYNIASASTRDSAPGVNVSMSDPLFHDRTDYQYVIPSAMTGSRRRRESTDQDEEREHAPKRVRRGRLVFTISTMPELVFFSAKEANDCVQTQERRRQDLGLSSTFSPVVQQGYVVDGRLVNAIGENLFATEPSEDTVQFPTRASPRVQKNFAKAKATTSGEAKPRSTRRGNKATRRSGNDTTEQTWQGAPEIKATDVSSSQASAQPLQQSHNSLGGSSAVDPDEDYAISRDQAIGGFPPGASPMPSNTKLSSVDGFPDGMSLYEICQTFPNHMHGEFLNTFIESNWSAMEIWLCFPKTVQTYREAHKKSLGTKGIAFAYLGKALTQQEKKLMSTGKLYGMLQPIHESPDRMRMRPDGRPPAALVENHENVPKRKKKKSIPKSKMAVKVPYIENKMWHVETINSDPREMPVKSLGDLKKEELRVLAPANGKNTTDAALLDWAQTETQQRL